MKKSRQLRGKSLSGRELLNRCAHSQDFVDIGNLSLRLPSGLPLLLAIVGCGIFGYGGAFVMHYVVVAESRGVEATSYATAFGQLLTVGSIGGFLGPVIGSILADIDASLPFILWSVVLSISMIAFSCIKGAGDKTKVNREAEGASE